MDEQTGSGNNSSQQLIVAFQGERGAFSEEAARKLLGRDIRTQPCRKFDELFEAVSSGEAEAALAPIENSLAGSIHQNYDLMVEHELTIIGEVYLHIIHNVIGLPGSSLANLRRVYSHPVALAQCARFFKSNPHIEAEAAYDTAGSVKMIMESGSPEHGAIGALAAAEVYGGQVIVEGVQDNNANYTRFLLLARPDRADSFPLVRPGEQYKTSLVFRVANRPGALFKSLASFALRDLDLTKIESRPIEGRPWEYSFYLDLKGNIADPALKRALGHLEELAESVRVLGSYPAAEQL